MPDKRAYDRKRKTKTETTKKMKVTNKEITPAIARIMLERNTGNRLVNQEHVRTLTREMLLGRWKFNGDTICLNGDRLIDGQHRLLAVVASGVTIETLVVEGLPSDVFDTKDIGKKRTAADTLSVRGETQCRNLAAALVVVDRYMTGRVGKKQTYTNTEVEDLLSKHPEARRSIRLCKETKKLIPLSVLAGAHYLFAKKDESLADIFVHQLISGSGISAGQPVYVLRERLLQNSMAKARLSPDYIFAITIKAWNATRAGKPVRALKFCEDGVSAEAFPVVQ